jgi:anti-anti-sigma regulatory factor
VNPTTDIALQLGPSLQIKDVEAVHGLLAQALEGEPPIKVDVSRLTAVDTAGIQLLLALRQEGTRRGITVQYCGDSPVLQHALTLLGLSAALFGASIP